MRGLRCALAGSRANLLAHWLGCVLACLRPIRLWWRPCRRACACPLACLRAGVPARNFAAELAGCRTRLLALACFWRSGVGAPACWRARLRGSRRVCALASWGGCLLTRAYWLAGLMPRAWYRAGPVAQTCWPNGERWLACVLTCWRGRKPACWPTLLARRLTAAPRASAHACFRARALALRLASTFVCCRARLLARPLAGALAC